MRSRRSPLAHALAFALLLVCPGLAAAEIPVLVTKWGSKGTAPGQFDFPNSVAVDAAGNVFVSDAKNHRVQKFSSSGAFLTQWGSDQLFSEMLDIAVDPAGNVYVSDFWLASFAHRIFKFSNSGTLLTQWGETGIFNTHYFVGVAADGAGNVYVCDVGHSVIQKYSNTGTQLGAFWYNLGVGAKLKPQDVAVDGSGEVYVLYANNHNWLEPYDESGRVLVFSSSGTFLRTFGSPGTGDGQFSSPTDIAVDGLGHVYVTDNALCRVQMFSSTGTFLGKWGTLGTGGGQFDNPVGVAATATGTVYVADSDNYQIKKFGGSSFHFPPTLTIVDWDVPLAGLTRLHLRWENGALESLSYPVSGNLYAQPFGVFLPGGPPVASFSVPPLPPSSQFDIFADVPSDVLPPLTAPLVLPGGGPGPGDPCPPVEWIGNLDVRWSEDEVEAHSDWHGGKLLVAPGYGWSFVHVVSACGSPAGSPWRFGGLLPGFSAELVEEDRATPAPAVLPPGWHGFVAVRAEAGTPIPSECCFDVFFRCDDVSARIELCATTCTWATTDVAGPGADPGFGIRSIVPNPARAAAVVRFTLPRAAAARLEIFDARGARVRTLMDGVRAEGVHFETWDGRDASGAELPRGVYFLRLSAAGREDTRKVVLEE